ncbi:hypothetical protein OHD16_27220 [Sphingobacterium sp. ML3W]|uniref:hypothetical protein n=1 Tax=Sphingobacterium sp. ML3W TaxID=1538644 RepID=UPI003009F7DF
MGALRAELGELVPSYMVPSRYVELSELPLTSNGKVDRKSLPDPDEGVLGTGTEYVGARNAVESLLVSIWEEVLGRSGIGIHDNFFDLGGTVCGLSVFRAVFRGVSMFRCPCRTFSCTLRFRVSQVFFPGATFRAL